MNDNLNESYSLMKEQFAPTKRKLERNSKIEYLQLELNKELLNDTMFQQLEWAKSKYTNQLHQWRKDYITSYRKLIGNDANYVEDKKLLWHSRAKQRQIIRLQEVEKSKALILFKANLKIEALKKISTEQCDTIMEMAQSKSKIVLDNAVWQASLKEHKKSIQILNKNARHKSTLIIEKAKNKCIIINQRLTHSIQKISSYANSKIDNMFSILEKDSKLALDSAQTIGEKVALNSKMLQIAKDKCKHKFRQQYKKIIKEYEKEEEYIQQDIKRLTRIKQLKDSIHKIKERNIFDMMNEGDQIIYRQICNKCKDTNDLLELETLKYQHRPYFVHYIKEKDFKLEFVII